MGILFYYMAVGKLPFQALSIKGLQEQILREEPDYSTIDSFLFVDFLKLLLKKD